MKKLVSLLLCVIMVMALMSISASAEEPITLTIERMEKIGMNNRTTFTRAFKRLEGITPNEYRILHKQIV